MQNGKHGYVVTFYFDEDEETVLEYLADEDGLTLEWEIKAIMGEELFHLKEMYLDAAKEALKDGNV